MSNATLSAKRIVAAALACALAFPSAAFASVRVDDTDLAPGENSVGGGIATYAESILSFENVVANTISTDESLSVFFNGGNDVDKFQVTDDANVSIEFEGENSVEDIEARDNANVTVHMDEHNEFEDVEAYDNASITANVDGEAECEAIKGYDNANVTVQGTNCPQKDVLTVGEGEKSERIGTEKGDLVVKDVTLVMDGEQDRVASTEGNVTITCSKIEGGDDSKRVDVFAGKDLFVGGSVIDIAGSIGSNGMLTIRRSDVDVEKADGDESPYRVWSKTGVKLIEEKNCVVREGTIDGKKVYYVDTDDRDEVHLEAALRPCYYKCDSDDKDEDDETPKHLPETGSRRLPATADETPVAPIFAFATGGALLVTVGMRRRTSR